MIIRIMGDRATGKTTSLLLQAERLAKKHPDKIIYFVGNHAIEAEYRDTVSKNIKFITPVEFWNMKPALSTYAVIDEVESFLGGLGVKAYSLTLSDRNLLEL